MARKEGHLTEEVVADLTAGRLKGKELLAADDHLQVCDKCMGLVASDRMGPKTISITEILGSEDDHLAFDQLAGHVDSVLDPIQSSIVRLHLEDCDHCRDQVAAMVLIREDLQKESNARPIMTPTPVSPKWQRWKVLIPVFTVVVIACLLWLTRTGTESTPPYEVAVQPIDEGTATTEPAPANGNTTEEANTTVAKVLTSLQDGEGTIALRADGSLMGLDSAPPALRKSALDALSSGKVSVGEGVKSAEPGRLMGGDEGVPFGLISPIGKVIRSQNPKFQWKALPGATAYAVKIFDENFSEIARSPSLQTPSWTPPSPLPRGATYRWQVTAQRGSEELKSPVRPAPDARFRVVDADANDELILVEKSFRGSNLLRAIAYARAGLKEEAQRELGALQRKNPRSQIVRKLADQLRRAR